MQRNGEITAGRTQSRRREDRPHLVRTGSPSAVLPIGIIDAESLASLSRPTSVNNTIVVQRSTL